MKKKFAKKIENIFQCSFCNSLMVIKEINHGKQVECPECESSLVMKTLSEKKNVIKSSNDTKIVDYFKDSKWNNEIIVNPPKEMGLARSKMSRNSTSCLETETVLLENEDLRNKDFETELINLKDFKTTNILKNNSAKVEGRKTEGWELSAKNKDLEEARLGQRVKKIKRNNSCISVLLLLSIIVFTLGALTYVLRNYIVGEGSTFSKKLSKYEDKRVISDEQRENLLIYLKSLHKIKKGEHLSKLIRKSYRIEDKIKNYSGASNKVEIQLIKDILTVRKVDYNPSLLDVAVQFENSQKRSLLVEQTKTGGFLLDWESLVVYCLPSWKKLVHSKESSKGIVRVQCMEIENQSTQYSKDKWNSYILAYKLGGESITAYLDKRSNLAKYLNEKMEESLFTKMTMMVERLGGDDFYKIIDAQVDWGAVKSDFGVNKK